MAHTTDICTDAGPRGASRDSFLALMIRRSVVTHAATTGLIVGPVIGAINYGDRILAQAMTSPDWWKIAVTFLVPYSVSTVSSALALRNSLPRGGATRAPPDRIQSRCHP